MGNDPVYCFNGQECLYKECRWWSVSQDNCKWTLTGIREDQYAGVTEKPTPPAQAEETPAEEQSPLQKIKPGDYVQKITVTMLEAAKAKTVTAQGEEKEIIEVLVTDQFENAQLTVWPPLAQSVKVKPAGTVLHLEALGSSEYKGELQLKSTRKTTISYS